MPDYLDTLAPLSQRSMGFKDGLEWCELVFEAGTPLDLALASAFCLGLDPLRWGEEPWVWVQGTVANESRED